MFGPPTAYNEKHAPYTTQNGGFLGRSVSDGMLPRSPRERAVPGRLVHPHATRDPAALEYSHMLEPLRNELEVETDKMDQTRMLTSVGMRCLLKPGTQPPSTAPDGESKVAWVANKRFEISKFKFKFPRARTYEIVELFLGCIEAKFCK